MEATLATFIPAPKCIRTILNWTNSDSTFASSRFYLTYTGTPPTGADLAAMAGAAITAADSDSGITPYMHESWTATGASCTDLTADMGPVGEVSDDTPGGLSGGRLPASTALVIAQSTARRYRGGHSRVYLPVGDDTKLTSDNAWSDTFISNVVDGWGYVVEETYGAAWSGAGEITQVMASFYSGYTNEAYGSPTKYRRVPTPRVSCAYYPIVTYLGRTRVCSQRRRLGKLLV